MMGSHDRQGGGPTDDREPPSDKGSHQRQGGGPTDDGEPPAARVNHQGQRGGPTDDGKAPSDGGEARENGDHYRRRGGTGEDH